MTIANNALIITGLDFETIRLNLRNYIASKPDFTDYDFNDSALGSLLDLLAFNTYMNAFYVNMGVNESFLDSAQIRDSVVSRAKMLGYLPRSARGPSANIFVRFPAAVGNGTFTTITVAKNTSFTSTVNGVSYKFVTPQSYLVEANSTGGFGRYLTITEGVPLTHRYTFSTANTAFVLPNDKIDVRSIEVTVNTSGNTQTYKQASDLRTANSSAKLFFVEADRDSKYKIAFGDGVMGRKPAVGSVVSVSYRVCNGTKANGANSYSSTGNIGGQSTYSLTPVGRAAGGVEEETIESIKFNAPNAYETQNRAVTKSDYQRLILRDQSDVADVVVWGGEENDPPIYGKVFISVKPRSGTSLSSARKEEIRSELKKLNVVSIDAEFTDPSYMYLVPEVTVRYDSTMTTRTASEIAALVAARIVSFETNNLNSFTGRFRYSRFLDYIDGAEDSIVASSATIDLQKRFVPSTVTQNTYEFTFGRGLEAYNRTLPGIGSLTSSSFMFAGFTCYFDDDGDGNVRIYYKANVEGTATRIYLDRTAGTVNYTTGKVVLAGYLPTSYSSYIKVVVRPANPSIEPVRNQILLFSDVRISVIDDASGSVIARTDSVATLGQSAFYENESTGIASVSSY